MEKEPVEISGVLESFEGRRFRVRYTPRPGLEKVTVPTIRDYVFEEKQEDGSWKRVDFVSSLKFEIDYDKFATFTLTLVDGRASVRGGNS